MAESPKTYVEIAVTLVIVEIRIVKVNHDADSNCSK